MADSESFHSHHHISNTASTFSQLLFGNELDDHDHHVGDGSSLHLLGGLEEDDDDDANIINQSFNSTYFNVEKPPKMLWFSGYLENFEGHQDNVGGEMGLFGSGSCNNNNEVAKVVASTGQDKSGVTTCSDSTSASSPALESNMISSTGNEDAKGGKTKRVSGSNKRKAKLEHPASRVKGRREKLGDRITALQQLVSPFGKTDTASVLHEAKGYIRFLHDQVQVLCSPYLQHQPKVEESGEGEESRRDLRSMGLCLVPVECTVHVGSSNGADYWSPGTMVNDVVSPGDKITAG